MGTFTVPLRLSSLDGKHTRDIKATAGGRAVFSVAPASFLKELGITPTRKSAYRHADGRRGEMDVGEAIATINGDSVITLVVFGPDDCTPLLGNYTLEGLQLEVDDVNQRLARRHVFTI